MKVVILFLIYTYINRELCFSIYSTGGMCYIVHLYSTRSLFSFKIIYGAYFIISLVRSDFNKFLLVPNQITNVKILIQSIVEFIFTNFYYICDAIRGKETKKKNVCL